MPAGRASQIAVLATVLPCFVAPAGAATRMEERYNVGGYLDVGKTKPYRFAAHAEPRPLPREGSMGRPASTAAAKALRAYMAKYPETTGVLLVERGKVVFEAYQGMGGPAREFYGMSIGKSLTALAVGRALCAGKIQSLDTAAGAIVAELRGSYFGKSTIRQLLTMSSGAYRGKIAGRPDLGGKMTGPMRGMTWRMRLGTLTAEDLLWGWAWTETRNKTVHPPGAAFIYKNGDTLAIGAVLERSTGMSVAAYFDTTIWRAVRPAHAAHWEADSDGSTMVHAGFQARLEDWGRFAAWLLDAVQRPGCFGDYLRTATRTQIQIRKKGGLFRGYGYQWWTDNRFAPGFWGLGYAGQVLALNPKTGKALIKFGYAKYGRNARDICRIFDAWNRARRD